jgi:hypothetical protein
LRDCVFFAAFLADFLLATFLEPDFFDAALVGADFRLAGAAFFAAFRALFFVAFFFGDAFFAPDLAFRAVFRDFATFSSSPSPGVPPSREQGRRPARPGGSRTRSRRRS